MATAELTAQRLRELLDYNPATGVFTWRIAAGLNGCIPAGTVAGGRHGTGYLVISVGDRQYSCHRLAILYVTGAWPTADTDHINGIRNDNRFTNLRCVSRGVNCENLRHANSRNTHGFLGVSRRTDNFSRPWQAQISVNGVSRHLGSFATPEAAHQAYLEAKRRLHDGCTI